MCGIAGIVDPSGVDRSDVRRMADAQAHRGPDDATTHVEQGVGFGFRRLSIIDLETGRQPIANEDETVYVMLNGEIYNYEAVRRELIARGHEFRTHSDTEVLVHLYEERGADLVHAIRGMFAFAIWDRRRQMLTLARDHLGQKPLYWAQDGNRFYFASEIKAILAVAPQFRQVNHHALHEYLSLRVISEPRSMFAGVHKLPAAHVLQLSGGQVTMRRYWDLEYEPKRRLSETEALGQVDEALRETVRLHLVSDVPVGAFLSGGIDSGLVTALAQELSEAPLQTFSVGVPYGGFNEAPAARAVAERHGTVHHEEEVDGNLAALLPTLVSYLDEPSDPLSACMYWLARMTRRHVKVVVGGDGGDELFGGYDRYYGTEYVRYYAALPRLVRRQVVRRILDLAPDGFWYKSLTHKLKWMDELAEVDGGRRYARGLSYFYFPPNRTADLYTDAFRAATKGFDAEASLIAWQDTEHAKAAVDKMLLADSMVRLPNHPVMILDRMTMAHGLEARSPFLDHVFAGLCATLPPRLKIRGRQRRYIQMRLAERYLPQEVLRRPKQGFSSGLPYLMGKQFRALFAEYLPRSRLVEEGFLRGAPIATLLRDHLEGRNDHGNRLWLLLNAELWYRVFIDQMALHDLDEEVRGVLAITASSSRSAAVPS